MHSELRRITLAEANAFYTNYEHLGNCGLGVWHWGQFSDGRLISVVSFGTACFSSRGLLSCIARKHAVGIYQLCRGGTVFDAPAHTPSRTIAAALRALCQERGECIVVAYADPTFHEVGTIYQACNAIYLGRTNPKGQSDYVINGKRMSGWVVRKRYGTRCLKRLLELDTEVVRVPLNRKYRYLLIATSASKKKEIIRTISPVACPYPKRDSEKIPSMQIGQLVLNRIVIAQR